MKDSLLLELAQALSEGLARRQHFWTALLIVVALLTAWLAARLMRRRVADRLRSAREREGRAPDALQFSIDGVRRLMFPVTGQIALWLGEGVLRLTGVFRQSGGERLLRLAMTLLGAMAVVRLVVYVLRRVFRRMAWIAA